jgi:PAS domain S-box-containing protein
MWKLSSDVMLVAGLDAVIQSVNPAWRAVFGWAEQDMVGRNFIDLTHPEDRAATRAEVDRLRRGIPTQKFENRYRRRDGSYLWLSWRAVPDENAIHAVGRDITAEREQASALQAAEEALRQAQKMEAVGQLTGGIAHDFNNLLQGIVGALEMIDKRIAQSRQDEVEKFVAAARTSANRAVALTHRLLAFSRRQPLDPKPVDANPLVASMEDLLHRTMGERIAIRLDLAPDLWPTLCDPNQLESAILNLAINARDAMPDGGTLVLETTNIVLDAAYTARNPDLKPGDYICLAVSDTGTGMPASVVEQAFEPFFTTKPIGQGTGLGLSMIYGFTRQSEGHAKIYSELGVGTTIKLFLPRCTLADDAAAEPAAAADLPRAGAGETVLVVEDEAVVRGLVVEVLDELGYHALEAADGPAGLEILRTKKRIDLLVTDIGLPGLTGRQLADAARVTRPALKILFMTGYAETAAMSQGFLEPGMAIVTKPFPIDVLANKIRSMIET